MRLPRYAQAIIAPRRERQALDAAKHWSDRPQRSGQYINLLGANTMATMERIPPPTIPRNEAFHRLQANDCRPVDAFGRWMHCVKRMGQSRMARDFERQVTEVQIRIAILDRYTAFGTPIAQTLRSVWENGKPALQTNGATKPHCDDLAMMMAEPKRHHPNPRISKEVSDNRFKDPYLEFQNSQRRNHT